MIFAYFGPDAFLPFTSCVAAVVGMLLMFGRNTARFVKESIRQLLPGRVQAHAHHNLPAGTHRSQILARRRTPPQDVSAEGHAEESQNPE